MVQRQSNTVTITSCSLPNFLIVGAAKAGTTSLFHYLNSHPQVFIPEIKECRFFSEMPGNFKGVGAAFQNDVINDIDNYQKLFEPGKKLKVRGDISNDYLFYHRRSTENIKKYLNKDVKIIIILRNPVDRAYSNYLHHVSLGWEKISFEEAIIAEPMRKAKQWAWPWYYLETGKYHDQVKTYLENFPNVKVFLYEDMKSTKQILVEIFEFITVNTNVPIDTSRIYHKASIPVFNSLTEFLRGNNPVKDFIRPLIKKFFSIEKREKIKGSILRLNQSHSGKPMQETTRLFLVEYFKEDILKLEKLIHKDLSGWLKI